MGLSIRNSKTHFFHFFVNATSTQKAIRTKMKRTTRPKAPHESLHYLGTLEKENQNHPFHILQHIIFKNKFSSKSDSIWSNS